MSAVDVLAAMGREHCMSTGRRGQAPYACKCGRWSLESLPPTGKSGSTTLRARLMRLSELYQRHIRAERATLARCKGGGA